MRICYQVVETLDEIARSRCRPKSLRVDNGPEFAGRALDQWAYLNCVEIYFSRPGNRLHSGAVPTSEFTKIEHVDSCNGGSNRH